MSLYSSSATSLDVAEKQSPLIEKIKMLAAEEIGCDEEDFMVDDYAGGNIDDAYQMGISHGEVLLARELLMLLLS